LQCHVRGCAAGRSGSGARAAPHRPHLPTGAAVDMLSRSRVTIAANLLLVFASGILVGIESHRLYSTTSTARANSSPQNMSEFRKRYLEGMRTQVGANPEQIAQINLILEDTKNKVQELAAAEKPLHDRIQQEHIDQIKAL